VSAWASARAHSALCAALLEHVAASVVEQFTEIVGEVRVGEQKDLDIDCQFHHCFWMGDLNYRCECMYVGVSAHGD
jgi:hypothetical protein